MNESTHVANTGENVNTPPMPAGAHAVSEASQPDKAPKKSSTRHFGTRILAALAAAALTALATHAINLLAFFIGNGFQTPVLNQVNLYFLPTTLIFFIILAILFLANSTRYWYTTFLAGLVAAVIAAFLGGFFNLLTSDTPINSEVISYLFGTLTSLNLIYLVAAVITSITIGRRIYHNVIDLRLHGTADSRRTMLVRVPSPNLGEGLITHIERTTVNRDLAEQQWDNYVEVLSENGWTIEQVEPAAENPDSVFVEDIAVVVGNTAVITNSGAIERRPETVTVETTLRELGLTVTRIEEPGILDGGDVLTVGSTLYVGRSERTNGHGINQLRNIVRSLGYKVVTVPLNSVLHLKSVATALPDGTVIGYAAQIENTSVFERFLPVPEKSGANVIALDDDTVLMSASAPQTTQLLTDCGYTVITIDISEFEKCEGSLTCLGVPLR